MGLRLAEQHINKLADQDDLPVLYFVGSHEIYRRAGACSRRKGSTGEQYTYAHITYSFEYKESNSHCFGLFAMYSAISS